MSDAADNRVGLGNVPSGVGYATGAKSGGRLTVLVAGMAVVMEAARDVTFAAGDRVAFLKAGGVWVAVCRIGTAAVADQPEADLPPPSVPSVVTGSKTYTPVETRSRLGTRWRTDGDDLYQGQASAGNGNSVGAAFYGDGPRALAGATVLSASVDVRRRNGGGLAAAQPTTLWLVTEKTRPSGAPTLTLSTAGPVLRWGQASTSFNVPTAWAQSIVDGTAGGLAVFDSDGAPYVILDGRGEYAASFALTVRWSR